MRYESNRFHSRPITEALSSGIQEDGDSPDFLGDMASMIPSNASPYDVGSDDSDDPDEVRNIMDFMMPTIPHDVVVRDGREMHRLKKSLSILSDFSSRDDQEGVLETGEHRIPSPHPSVEMRRACDSQKGRSIS